MSEINSVLWIEGESLGAGGQVQLGKRLLTYRLQDRVMLISGLTGAIDVLTTEEYNKLSGNASEFAASHPSLAEQLARRGYLFGGSDAESRLESRLRNHIESESTQKEMVFMMCPTDFCPVGCNYCFAEDRVLKAERSVMTPEVIDSSFRSIAEIQARYSNRLSTMCLYGGEPFQDFTRDALEQIFQRSQEQGLRIAAFSSGLYTFEFKDLLSRYKDSIQTIAVTLDGTEASHSLMRKIGKSYQRAVATIDMLLSIGVPVMIKTNVNLMNIKDLPKLVQLYKEKGWWDNPLTKYELTPIQYRQISLERDTSYDLEMAFKFFDMRSEHPDLSRFDILPMADNKYGLIDGLGFHKFSKDSIPLQAAVPRLHSCPSYSRHFFVFTADGEFYLCNEEVGLKESSFGSFTPTGGGCGSHKIDYEKMETYYERDVCKLSPCTDCSYAFFCGGGCGHHAGGEDLAMCGTIHRDIGELVQRWAGAKELPELPLTGVQRMFGEQAMKAPATCKPETKDGMRVLR